MKHFAVIVLICFLSVVNGINLRKLDRINVDQVLKQKRLVNNFLKCWLDEGPCSIDGREIKKAIPEVLSDDSTVQLTPMQKEKIQKVLDHFKENYPTDYASLKKIYDPNDKAEKTVEQ